MAAGSQLRVLLSWPAWVALLQIPQLTAGGYETRHIVMPPGTETLPTTSDLRWRNRENATFFLFFFFFPLVDEVQPIFLTYLKALNLLSVTVFDYLPQESTVTWKSPMVFLGH